MIYADQIQNGPKQMQFSMAVVESAQMPEYTSIATAEQLNPGRASELSLSGSQVLVGCVAALCTVGVLLFALIRLWLFEA